MAQAAKAMAVQTKTLTRLALKAMPIMAAPETTPPTRISVRCERRERRKGKDKAVKLIIE